MEASRQRGFFVGEPLATVRAVADGVVRPAAPAAPLAAPVDATALIGGMFRRGSAPSGPGMGTLPEAWLDQALLDRAPRRTLAQAGESLRYGHPAGDDGLRQALSRRLGC